MLLWGESFLLKKKKVGIVLALGAAQRQRASLAAPGAVLQWWKLDMDSALSWEKKWERLDAGGLFGSARGNQGG